MSSKKGVPKQGQSKQRSTSKTGHRLANERKRIAMLFRGSKIGLQCIIGIVGDCERLGLNWLCCVIES